MNAASARKTDKFRRYRERKKAQGMREIRMWVPDVRSPEFQEALRRQIRAMNASAEEREIQAELDEAAAEVWNGLP
jgi:antidote-toxin recognition MazE-like antitoxin